jgi:hypothetical protein
MAEENRARFRNDSVNTPTPMTSDGGVASPNPPNDMPLGILNGNSVPMTLDPHSGGRNSALQNLEQKPGEVSRSARTAEIKRRLTSGDVKYK